MRSERGSRPFSESERPEDQPEPRLVAVTPPHEPSMLSAHVGHEYREPCQTLRLESILKDGIGAHGGDPFREAYFRTESGNIYRVVRGGLFNCNESRHHGSPVRHDIDNKVLVTQQLAVGEPFRYERGGQTTPITEIVATSTLLGRVYPMASLRKHHRIREFNTIVTEFWQGMSEFHPYFP